MKLHHHIAYRFLLNDELCMEMLETTYPDSIKVLLEKNERDWGKIPESQKILTLYRLLCPAKQKAYYVTETVLDKLNMLHLSKLKDEGRESNNYDWTFFKNIKPEKRTFIFPDNTLLRMDIDNNSILQLAFISFHKKPLSKNEGRLKWVLFYVNTSTGKQCDHFNHADVKSIEDFVYRLMCFVFFSTNEEILIPAGRQYGTRKNGKVINNMALPVTIINSRWNITTVRTDEFAVSGHFRLQPCGPNMAERKMVFINPYKKHGYIRKAKNLQAI